MMLNDPGTLVLLFAVISGLLLTGHFLYKRRPSLRPPGPPGLFGVGNFLDIPKHEAWREYIRWSQQYNSDVVSWSIPGANMVVLNSHQAATDLLEKRSSIYSSRPQNELLHLKGWSFSTKLKPYSDEWRLHRRILNRDLRAGVVRTYEDLQKTAVKTLLKNILHQPDEVFKATKKHAGSFAMKLTYGFEDTQAEKYIEMTQEAVNMSDTGSSPVAVMINIFPSLLSLPKWIPGIHALKAEAARSRDIVATLLNGPFQDVKEQMRKGDVNSSLMVTFLERNEQEGKGSSGERIMKEIITTIHAAAMDTTEAVVSIALLALVLHPDVQERAQAELDRVVGRERLPDFADWEQLPFIEAICREALRWKTAVPLGVMHMTTEDDVYKGYFIPKGSMVAGNAWAILHDPETYTEPDSFKPKRFITEDGQLSDDELLTVAFGFGRRICPGMHLARATLWITIASILTLFTIMRVKVENGNDIEVLPGYSDHTLVYHPLPFPCSAKLRDEKARALVETLPEKT